MIRVVLDTNVIVSALVFGGIPRGILELVEAGQCTFFYSEAIQSEVRRVLSEKFDWSEGTLREALPVLWSAGNLVLPREKIRAVWDDPDDDRILECAVEAQAQIIVSGDGHLLVLQKYRSILIVTPREFVEQFLRS